MDSTEEIWEPIPDFPSYEVSNMGNVMNVVREKLVKPQINPQGVLYVPLYHNRRKTTRAVRALVANAFVEGKTRSFDTPINRDGDKHNNRADNLVWRPRWFAVTFSRQFGKDYPHADKGPVFDVATGLEYESVYEVATTFGLLMKDVYRSSYSETAVFPTRQVFHIPKAIHVR